MSNTLITPTIGRVVHYYPEEWEVAYLGFARGEHTALIVAVHGDRMINVVVFDRQGNMFKRPSIPLLQEGDPAICGCHCEWMPYQKGQAAKTEEAEKKAAALERAKESL